MATNQFPLHAALIVIKPPGNVYYSHAKELPFPTKGTLIGLHGS